MEIVIIGEIIIAGTIGIASMLYAINKEINREERRNTEHKKDLYCDLCGEDKGKYIEVIVCEKCARDTYYVFDELSDNTDWDKAKEF